MYTGIQIDKEAQHPFNSRWAEEEKSNTSMGTST